MWDLINYNINVNSVNNENGENVENGENNENGENVENGENNENGENVENGENNENVENNDENVKQNESLNINLVENAVDITNTLYEQVRNNNTAFWSMLGYQENPNPVNQNAQNQEEEPYIETIQDEGENKKENDHETIDDTQNDSIEEMERILEENAKAKIEKKKKKKHEKKTERSSKNKLDTNHIFESDNGINKSPFFSDISSYANYYTSGEENSEDKAKNKNNEIVESDENDNEHKDSAKENSNESNNSENNETDTTPVPDSLSNDWFFSKIKEIIEPNINQETINQLLTNNYNSFSESNTGLYGLIDKVIRTNNSNNNYENMNIINKQSHHGNIYDHYNSMDVSPNDNYNFINYSIYCINKELSANVEMEAIKMLKIYAHTFNKFKKDINYKDDLYKDLLNEAEEQSTIILKNNRKKRILKIDFLNLANMNSENYNNIIESQTVQTPKIKLEDIFKISVN
ncbi:conserved Plasmodium protein, unknown function [Plasmodium vinckei brucechwatti]|uniref:Uncharacterized protein n=1 Tax=Plasmodium vinckei brucechwatti TaxID=119398 RepID=A0A6V7S6R2_PLAVN|nr:conserved Plasmodium protein, unknown function [Plasmodium vinckei brucechwatti]